jgi:hypothetical protein
MALFFTKRRIVTPALVTLLGTVWRTAESTRSGIDIGTLALALGRRRTGSSVAVHSVNQCHSGPREGDEVWRPSGDLNGR